MQGASLIILHYYSLGLVPSKGRAQTLQAMELDPKTLQKRGYTEPNTKWTAVNVSYLNRNAVSAECSAQNLHFGRLIYLYWSYLNIIQPFDVGIHLSITCFLRRQFRHDFKTSIFWELRGIQKIFPLGFASLCEYWYKIRISILKLLHPLFLQKTKM